VPVGMERAPSRSLRDEAGECRWMRVNEYSALPRATISRFGSEAEIPATILHSECSAQAPSRSEEESLLHHIPIENECMRFPLLTYR
jgi:hypothetical protein